MQSGMSSGYNTDDELSGGGRSSGCLSPALAAEAHGTATASLSPGCDSKCGLVCYSTKGIRLQRGLMNNQGAIESTCWA